MFRSFTISLKEYDNGTWDVELAMPSGSKVIVVAPSAADGCLEALEAVELDKMHSYVDGLKKKVEDADKDMLLMRLDHHALLETTSAICNKVKGVLQRLTETGKASEKELKILQDIANTWPPFKS